MLPLEERIVEFKKKYLSNLPEPLSFGGERNDQLKELLTGSGYLPKVLQDYQNDPKMETFPLVYFRKLPPKRFDLLFLPGSAAYRRDYLFASFEDWDSGRKFIDVYTSYLRMDELAEMASRLMDFVRNASKAKPSDLSGKIISYFLRHEHKKAQNIFHQFSQEDEEEYKKLLALSKDHAVGNEAILKALD
jgi:hypothetical protein